MHKRARGHNFSSAHLTHGFCIAHLVGPSPITNPSGLHETTSLNVIRSHGFEPIHWDYWIEGQKKIMQYNIVKLLSHKSRGYDDLMGLNILFGSRAHQNLWKTARLSKYEDPWIQSFRNAGERNSRVFFFVYKYAKFYILLKKEKKWSGDLLFPHRNENKIF